MGDVRDKSRGNRRWGAWLVIAGLLGLFKRVLGPAEQDVGVVQPLVQQANPHADSDLQRGSTRLERMARYRFVQACSHIW